MAGHADGVPVAGQADPGGEVAGIVLGRPDAVLRHLDRREPEPLRAGRAVDVPVQPGVVHEDLQAAADEQDQEQEVDVVGDAEPGRKAVRLRRRLGDHGGAGRQRRQADDGPLDVSGDKQKHEGRNEQEQCLASNAHDRESFRPRCRAFTIARFVRPGRARSYPAPTPNGRRRRRRASRRRPRWLP